MKNELQKCLMCKNPLCAACPAGTEVRRVIGLVREGKTKEAGELLFDNNPLTAITGAVCPNHLFCKGACVLGRKGNAVDFGKIEREISEAYLEHVFARSEATKQSQTDPQKKVLIVGSGPAGIALSYYLNKAGLDVTVLEKEEQFGGMLRYGIPNFRLDKSLIDKIIGRLEKMGIEFLANSPVDLKNLPSEYDISVLAIGAGISRSLGIDGEQLTVPALEYLKNPKQSDNVIVIGAGNVAIDCALTAAELGAKSVNLCYRKDEAAMKAYPEELEYARNKGVVFNYFMVPKKVTKEGVTFDKQGEEVFMPADTVIVAIGQGAVDLDLCGEYGIGCTQNGLIKTDKFKTNKENVFAIGDAVTGTSTIIQVVGQAKELANYLILCQP